MKEQSLIVLEEEAKEKAVRARHALPTDLERIMAPRLMLAQDLRFFMPTRSTRVFAKQPGK